MANSDALPDLSVLREISGLEFMQRILDGRLPPPPIAATLKFELAAVAEGEVQFTASPGLHGYNPLGSMHGGWYGVLLDSAMGCAVMTKLAPGYNYTTLEYKVNILRAATRDSGEVRALGQVVRVGRRSGVAEGRIVGVEDGKLYATGSTTCLVFPI